MFFSNRAVSRLDIAEIYVGLAARALRTQGEGWRDEFIRWDSTAYTWEQHHEWVEARRPKHATPEHYMEDN